MSPETQASDLKPQAPIAPAAISNQADPPPENVGNFADSIIATMPIALLVLETDLRVRAASRTFYDTFGVTREMTEGLLVYTLGNGQWDIPELRVLLEDILPKNRSFIDYEVEHIFQGLGRRTMLLNGRQFDHVQLILLVIVDITERKQAEEALQASHKRLQDTLDQLQDVQVQLIQQEQLAAVGRLAAGIAHDFNNILSVIMLNVELSLLTPLLPPKHRQHLETIAQHSNRAAQVVQQILDFGHRAALHRLPLDLVPFLNEQTELWERSLPAGIKIHLSYGQDKYIIEADSTRIRQIFTNLVFNARDAMLNGGQLDISLERFRLANQATPPSPGMPPGEWVQVSVRDTGTGIPLATLANIFEPFYTTKEPGKGNGLGLAQVYGLVKQHQGFINVRTEEGKGSTFTVYLPTPGMTPPSELPALPLGQGETILISEDNADLRDALVDSLKLLNYRPLIAANGQEILATLARHTSQIALVLTDFLLPDMEGGALFHALRQHDPTLPVVMLGSYAVEAELQALRAQGLTDWLPKPHTVQQLADTLAEILQKEVR